MTIRRFPAFLIALAAATSAAAGPFDRVYRPDAPEAESWDCQSVGSDGGALAVREDVFYGVQSACLLTNPVAVNGTSGVLYEAQCNAEVMSYSKRMMLMLVPKGLAAIEDDDGNPLRRCP